LEFHGKKQQKIKPLKYQLIKKYKLKLPYLIKIYVEKCENWKKRSSFLILFKNFSIILKRRINFLEKFRKNFFKFIPF
jgi:hypothetical protein